MNRSTRQRVFATANSILEAARDGGLDDAAFHQISDTKAADVIRDVRETFTSHGRATRGAAPLWKALREPTAALSASHELSALLGLGPAETVFLLVEDWGAIQEEPLWVFATTVAGAVATLENHHGLEYYIVARSFDWLVAENDHNVLIAAGADAASVLARISG